MLGETCSYSGMSRVESVGPAALGVAGIYTALSKRVVVLTTVLIEWARSSREAIFKAIFLTALLRPEAIFSHFQTAFLPAAERPKRFLDDFLTALLRPRSGRSES